MEVRVSKDARARFEVIKARPEEARELLQEAVLSNSAKAVETFGRLAHQHYVKTYADWLHETGDAVAAAKVRGAWGEVPDIGGDCRQ
jgi:hypothetical protein